MKWLNKKGMTLFELLAVIVILGIIAAIAFPTVNALIDNSRKDSAIANATNFVDRAVTEAKTDFTVNNYGEEHVYFIFANDDNPDTVNVDETNFPESAKSYISENHNHSFDLSSDISTCINCYVVVTIDAFGNAYTSHLSFRDNGDGNYLVEEENRFTILTRANNVTK